MMNQENAMNDLRTVVKTPVEPTAEMLKAGAKAWDYDPRFEDIEFAIARIYSAMLAAAPSELRGTPSDE